MMAVSNQSLKIALQNIIKSDAYGIEAEVAREALENTNVTSFFSDLLQHGCVSGMIGSLVYYHDTFAFFDKHYREIEIMREECEAGIGEPLQINGDLKNFLAWFTFEETAYQLAMKLELEV